MSAGGYDDLKRFKDKTHTNKIDFKTISAQVQETGGGNWAIVNQLNTEATEGPFSNSESTARAAPDEVAPDFFKTPPVQPARPDANENKNGPVSAPNTASSASSQARPPYSAPLTPARSGTEAPAQAMDAAEKPLSAELPQQPVTPQHPTAHQQNALPPASSAPVNFSQLFASPSPAPASRKAVKETPLQPLLERIASCR